MRTFLPIILCLVYLVLAPVASAQKKSGVEIAPALIDITLDAPGQEEKLEFTLTNYGENELNLELFPIDFKQKDEHGGISFVGQDASTYSYSLSSFLELETQTVLLAPNETKKVIVIVRNRQDLSPGGHYAALVARVVQETDTPAVAPALSSLILLRKTGGERYNLSLREISWPKSLIAFSYKRSLQLLFQNEGNVHLTPYGTITITDMLGRKVYDGNLNSPSGKIFPSSRRYIIGEIRPLTWSLPVSINRIAIKGQDSLNKTHFSYNESFVYVHPATGGVLLLPIAVYLLRRKRKIKK